MSFVAFATKLLLPPRTLGRARPNREQESIGWLVPSSHRIRDASPYDQPRGQPEECSLQPYRSCSIPSEEDLSAGHCDLPDTRWRYNEDKCRQLRCNCENCNLNTDTVCWRHFLKLDLRHAEFFDDYGIKSFPKFIWCVFWHTQPQWKNLVVSLFRCHSLPFQLFGLLSWHTDKVQLVNEWFPSLTR